MNDWNWCLGLLVKESVLYISTTYNCVCVDRTIAYIEVLNYTLYGVETQGRYLDSSDNHLFRSHLQAQYVIYWSYLILDTGHEDVIGHPMYRNHFCVMPCKVHLCDRVPRAGGNTHYSSLGSEISHCRLEDSIALKSHTSPFPIFTLRSGQVSKSCHSKDA